ncbi:MAG: hypothetical protein M1829_006951 [Trizodia sp. TS-e1964]|nr:MAG: hypothetical protein M1829_006951 [Trizodia sp. TS-e1964]
MSTPPPPPPPPPPPSCRLIPQPVETSTRSHGTITTAALEASRPLATAFGGDEAAETGSDDSKLEYSPKGPETRSLDRTKVGQLITSGQQRFVARPVETSSRSSRAKLESSASLHSECEGRGPAKPPIVRRFTPQLIETNTRTRRAGNKAPALLLSDKTESSPSDDSHTPGRDSSLRPPQKTPTSSSANPQLARRPRGSARRHSFMIPSLDPILSRSDTEESNCPSLSTSPSAVSEGAFVASAFKIKSRRESCDDKYTEHLLSLAADAAEKQLRYQAMAAYANDDHHETVDHFAVEMESEASDEDLDLRIVPLLSNQDFGETGRRESMADLVWHLRELRNHQEELQRQRKEPEKPSAFKKPPPISPFIAAAEQLTMAHEAARAPNDIIGGWQRGVGFQARRKAASPPMLGGDLVFPFCLSPQQTLILDVDHHLRNDTSTTQADGLGLWRGCCSASRTDAAMLPIHTGLITPAPDRDVPFFDDYPQSAEPTPISPAETSALHLTDEAIHLEFSDEFVTQVYNYLSLGYPSLARRFDEELSKISLVPIEELSAADGEADAKGYVGLGDEGVRGTDTVTNGRCGRWKALRAYITVWAKHNPAFTDGAPGADPWGARARRGSWAL